MGAIQTCQGYTPNNNVMKYLNAAKQEEALLKVPGNSISTNFEIIDRQYSLFSKASGSVRSSCDALVLSQEVRQLGAFDTANDLVKKAAELVEKEADQ